MIGIPVFKAKLLAFAISSFILGVAGALWAGGLLALLSHALRGFCRCNQGLGWHHVGEHRSATDSVSFDQGYVCSELDAG